VPLPQAGRIKMNPEENAWVKDQSGDEALRRVDSLQGGGKSDENHWYNANLPGTEFYSDKFIHYTGDLFNFFPL